MKIKKARYMGFCFGVERAVNLTNDALGANKNCVYSLGSVIHNPQVMEDLKSKGLKVIEDIKDIKSGIFLIRSHGVSPKILKKAAGKGLNLVNGTCPFVKRCHTIVRHLKRQRFKIIIVGQRYHPEVVALLDAAGPKSSLVIDSVKEAKRLKILKQNIGIIAQTTQNTADYFDIINILLGKNFKRLRIFNTICLDVRKRQQAARQLAKDVDMIFVVGGKNSANTKRLARILRRMKKHVYHIETADDIKYEWLKDKRAKTIGITSGASTPEWIIEAVINRLKNK